MRPLLSLIAGLLRLSTCYVAGDCFGRGLLAKTRGLYDAPYTQGLISFNCAVEFDWKQHFVDAQRWLDPTKAVSPAAISASEHLQTVPLRVFADRSGAVVSPIPNSPDLTGVAHAVELEQHSKLPVGPLRGLLPATRPAAIMEYALLSQRPRT